MWKYNNENRNYCSAGEDHFQFAWPSVAALSSGGFSVSWPRRLIRLLPNEGF